MTTVEDRPATKYNVFTGGRVPVKSWAQNLEQGALDQAIAAADLPFIIKHIAVMADGHQGFGVPIGSVVFASNAVIPYAAGVDIGCGVTLIETNLTVEGLEPGQLRLVLDQIARDVPTGHHGHKRALYSILDAHDEILRGLPANFELPSPVALAFQQAVPRIGTLGGGNHFIEVERDAEGHIYVMLHSGSRSYGKKTCDYYHALARKMNEKWHSQQPNTFLSYFPADDALGQEYMDAMNFGLNYAELNRRSMADIIIAAFNRHVAGFEGHLTVDIHHNYAARENHFKQNGIVHRKGAVRARKGETVLIPGSMGVGSYIATGLGNPDSFMSCQHGAGRAMSRTAATQQWNRTTLAAEMAAAGILMAGDAANAVDESPGAYKPIEDVMAASSDLITPVRKLTPLGVLKGD